MANCLVKSVILYIIIISMLLIIKPQTFYYDTEKTNLKPWNLYRDTKATEDLLTFHTTSILLGVIVFFTINNL